MMLAQDATTPDQPDETSPALRRLARRARLLPPGAVPVRLRPLRPRHLPGRTAASERLADLADLGRQHDVAPARQHARCDLHQRVRDPAGPEAACSAGDRGSRRVDGAARVCVGAVAALRGVHADVARMDRHGNGRHRDRREPLVREASRPRHQPCLHRRERRVGSSLRPLLVLLVEQVGFQAADADRGSDHGCRSRARRHRLGRPAADRRSGGWPDGSFASTESGFRDRRHFAPDADAPAWHSGRSRSPSRLR